MGEDIKQGASKVYMTFGIGALTLFSLVLPLQFFSHFFETSSNPRAIPDFGELWIPIGAAVVFSLHSIGALMILFGSFPISRLSKGTNEADQLFYKSAANADERIWELVIENRRSLNFVRGITGLMLFHVIIFSFSVIRYAFGVEPYLSYDWTFIPIAVSGIFAAVYSASALNLRLQLLCTGIELAKLHLQLPQSGDLTGDGGKTP